MSESNYKKQIIEQTANRVIENTSHLLYYFYIIDNFESAAIKFLNEKGLLYEFKNFFEKSKIGEKEMAILREGFYSSENEDHRSKARTALHSCMLTATIFSAFLELEGGQAEKRFNSFSSQVGDRASKLAYAQAEKNA